MSRRRKLKVYCGDIEDNIFTENIWAAITSMQLFTLLLISVWSRLRIQSSTSTTTQQDNQTAESDREVQGSSVCFLAQQQFTNDVKLEDMLITEESSVNESLWYE